jgi:hypothetical protein
VPVTDTATQTKTGSEPVQNSKVVEWDFSVPVRDGS